MQVRPIRLRYLRVSQGLTQLDVARLAGISLSTYQWLEAGYRKTARAKTLGALCQVFGVELDEIVWMDEEVHPDEDDEPQAAHG